MDYKILKGILNEAEKIRVDGKLLLCSRFKLKESNILLKTDEKAFYPAAKAAVKYRVELDRYVEEKPEILWALEPIDCDENAPRIVKMMCMSAKKAKVGPMAAVAGALADLIAEAALQNGAAGVLVENGGELFVDGKYQFTVSIGAGKSPISQQIGLKLTPDLYPIGIATSSATVGHALSFGMADAVTVVSRNAALADALATAICNATRGERAEEAVKQGLRAAESYNEVRGVLIIVRDKVGVLGEIPELIRIQKDSR
ncbi:UPF0280 family protein [Candidatus Bathyarchaeota archaeon]|nr:UPF0280 family protein [Candidatus Bathyarchaeota archaeon]